MDTEKGFEGSFAPREVREGEPQCGCQVPIF